MGYNKIEAGFAQMVATIGGTIITGISAIEYSDSVEKTNNYGAGSKPVSRSYGKYEAKGKVTLHMSEVEALQVVAPSGDIKNFAPFDITVTFEPLAGGNYVVHKLRGCEFMGNMRTMKTGDMVFEVELELIIDTIDWK